MAVERDRVAEDGVTKLLDMEASSRIQILSAPIQLPGVCGLCGTSRTDDRQYIDIGLWVEFYGQFYFCTFCFSQFTNRLGGLTPDQATDIENELDQARQRILEFQEKEVAINGVIDTLRATGLFTDSGILSDASVSSSSIKQDTLQFDDIIERDKHKSVKPEQYSSEASSKQGSDDVPSTRSNELDNWL